MNEPYETFASSSLRMPVKFSVWLDEPDYLYRELYEIRYQISPSDIDGINGYREPHVSGRYNSDTSTLQIENIEKGPIDAGQNFLLKTLSVLLKDKPETKKILLANINHSKTLSFLQECKSPGDRISPETDKYCGPLIHSLVKLGCSSIKVVREGTAYWSIEAEVPKLL